MIAEHRAYSIKDGKPGEGPVIYWMSRDHRAYDNWSLLFAQDLALENSKQLLVVFNLVSDFLEAGADHFSFMLKGLAETLQILAAHKIPFFLLSGQPASELPEYINKRKPFALVTDFDPLKIKRKWQKDVADKVFCPVYIVDAHNIVPARFASDKQEYAAYTFRKKINKHLDNYLLDYPALKVHESNYKFHPGKILSRINDQIYGMESKLKQDILFIPGEEAAHNVLKDFINNRLDDYAKERNDPSKDHLSGLSPYLHFGKISAQRVALEVKQSGADKESVHSFLDELIVRKELSDNFCYYNHDYDNFNGFPDWAKETLDKHKSDKREHLYTTDELENAKTHDPAWNAAQIQMMRTGKMHGYMRMYWAKKILEWTNSPEDAHKAAIYLNDKYELDGRDPNGYTGIAWSIGGIHDRPWQEREIFGKVRYMNFQGLKRKFDIQSYIDRWIKDELF